MPFAKMECSVLGVDMSPSRIETARKCFAELGLPGDFIAADIFTVKELEHQFDLIICHDVITCSCCTLTMRSNFSIGHRVLLIALAQIGAVGLLADGVQLHQAGTGNGERRSVRMAQGRGRRNSQGRRPV